MKSLVTTNFALHASKVPSQVEGMNVFQTSCLTYVDSGLPCDTFNIIHLNNEQLSQDELREAVDYYRNKNFPFCVWIPAEHLTQKVELIFSALNLQRQNAEPGMVLLLSTADVRTPTTDIRIITKPSELREFAQVIAKNWTPPDYNIIKYYERVEEVVLQGTDNITLLGCYDANQIVAVGELFPSDRETIGLYGIATLAEFRGKGLGTAMMSFALSKAKELGYKHAILQASEDGIGIYKKLGFEVVTTYYEYQPAGTQVL